MRILCCSVMLVCLSACAGYQKGTDVGVGFDSLDTISKEEKEKQKWFDSFYGKTASCETTIWGTKGSCDE